jgi:hypothetical protein
MITAFNSHQTYDSDMGAVPGSFLVTMCADFGETELATLLSYINGADVDQSRPNVSRWIVRPS